MQQVLIYLKTILLHNNSNHFCISIRYRIISACIYTSEVTQVKRKKTILQLMGLAKITNWQALSSASRVVQWYFFFVALYIPTSYFVAFCLCAVIPLYFIDYKEVVSSTKPHMTWLSFNGKQKYWKRMAMRLSFT